MHNCDVKLCTHECFGTRSIIVCTGVVRRLYHPDRVEMTGSFFQRYELGLAPFLRMGECRCTTRVLPYKVMFQTHVMTTATKYIIQKNCFQSCKYINTGSTRNDHFFRGVL